MSRLSMIVALALISWAQVAVSLLTDHEVTELPGWSGPLPSRMFSGYLSVGPNKSHNLHYWLIESERSPQNDPLVIWVNGGPGCSSLLGAMTELGPINADERSLQGDEITCNGFSNCTYSDEYDVPVVYHNKYSWSSVANMLFLEMPAGVGFSYCGDPEECSFDDASTAAENFEFLLEFFKSYPEYGDKDLYITGESYAGIYIPTLARKIMNDDVDGVIPLKGFAIGNGCTGYLSKGSCGVNWEAQFMEYAVDHFLIGKDVASDICRDCCGVDGVNGCRLGRCEGLMYPADIQPAEQRFKCYMTFSTALYGLYDQLDNGMDIYNIFDQCSPNNLVQNVGLARLTGITNMNIESRRGTRGRMMLEDDDEESVMGESTIQAGVRCGREKASKAWLNHPSVRTALHVENANVTGGFETCTGSGPRPWSYNSTEENLLDDMPILASQYRILIYSGDSDMIVDQTGTEMWTADLGIPKLRERRPWAVDGGPRTAGYVIEYVSNFTYATVKGAGHMVPTNRPREALAMLTYFLNGTPFPTIEGFPTIEYIASNKSALESDLIDFYSNASCDAAEIFGDKRSYTPNGENNTYTEIRWCAKSKMGLEDEDDSMTEDSSGMAMMMSQLFAKIASLEEELELLKTEASPDDDDDAPPDEDPMMQGATSETMNTSSSPTSTVSKSDNIQVECKARGGMGSGLAVFMILLAAGAGLGLGYAFAILRRKRARAGTIAMKSYADEPFGEED